jgi:hypothetical protein
MYFNVIRNPAKPKSVIEIEPVEYDYKPLTKRLALFDTETDPFRIENGKGRDVKPFTCGIYFPDTGEYYDFWGDDCIAQYFEFMAANYAEEELLIVCHNFGNFDFYFCVDYMDSGSAPFIMNGRMVKVMLQGQEYRDSYSIIPVALGIYQKTEIDYDKFERPVREQNKEEIRAYQKDDCVFLGELVKEFYAMFGDRLTIAGVALPKLRSFHGFLTMSAYTDEKMRPYYFGGRNQCFETGVLRPRSTDKWTIFDVRSMYPRAMESMQHPVSSEPIYETKITDRTHFAHINATSYGALPVRIEDGPSKGGLSFPIGRRDFYACIHEIRAGLETGTLKIHKTYSSIYFKHETNFKAFIDEFFALRKQAKLDKDKVRDLLYKLVMNSSYGKFAQDPRKYEKFLFDPDEFPCSAVNEKGKTEDENDWYVHSIRDGRFMFAKPQGIKGNMGFFNVATAASITSGARSILLRGLARATRPIYCDTDSIICEALDVPPDAGNLGDWEIEAEGDIAFIAGKKLYAVMHSDRDYAEKKRVEAKDKNPLEVSTLPDGTEIYRIKKAHKGVKLTADEIIRVANGEVVEYANPVPKFKLNGDVEFVTRNIKRTAE